MVPCPYQLPLTRDQFADALKRGHGRALMHVQAHGLAGIEDLFLQACTHDYAWDSQCEGSRAPWLIEMLVASGEESRLVGTMLPGLAALDDPWWHGQHRVDMLMHLAKRGHGEARNLLYASLRVVERGDASAEFGFEEIIELDGAEGLLRVADWHGRRILADPQGENPQSSYWYSFDEVSDWKAAWALLEREAEHNANIAAYLDQCRKDEAGEADQAPRIDDSLGKSADEVIQAVEASSEGNRVGWLRRWSQNVASPEDRARVFEQLLRTTDVGKLRSYMHVLAFAPLPHFDARLLPYVDHADDFIPGYAFQALAHFQHPAVRAFAVSRLRGGTGSGGEFGLLVKNFVPGDEALIASVLRFPHEELRRDDWRESEALGVLHWQLSDLLKVFGEHPDADATPTMLFCCEHNPCATCRQRALDILMSRGDAPDWLLEECRHDASDDIRQLVASPPATPPAQE